MGRQVPVPQDGERSETVIIKLSRGVINRHRCTFWKLVRETDVSGVSGTGIPAVGVFEAETASGCFLLVWSGRQDEGFETEPSIQFHPSIENAKRVHEHAGASRLVEVTDDKGIDDIIHRIQECFERFWEARDEDAVRLMEQ